MNEATLNEILKIGAAAAVECFAKTGAQPTEAQVQEWVLNNWDQLAAGMAKGVALAAA